MKYKLELWKYDIFSYEEAEEHLNQMARQGYELIRITLEWCPLAVYRKVKAPSKKRYCVEMAMREDKDFFQLCKESNWEKILCLKNNQCVFFTEEKDAKPLFTDPISRYENAAEVINKGEWCENSIAATVVIALLAIWLVVDHNQGSKMLYLLIGTIIFTGFILLQLEINKRWVKRRASQGYIHGTVQMPKWIKGMNRFANYLGNTLMLLILGYYFVKFAFIEQNTVGVILVVITPMVFVSGFFVREVMGKRALGFGIMFLAAWLAIGGIRILSELTAI